MPLFSELPRSSLLGNPTYGSPWLLLELPKSGYLVKEKPARKRKGLVCLKTNEAEDNPPVYAARAIFPHVAGWEIRIDARKVLGVRFFTTDLPQDFGLRSILGLLPRP